VKISKELKIGVVVVLAVAAFVWGLSFLKGTNLFSHKYYLYAVYPKIEGLIPSSPLMVSGYKVGQVNKIDLITKDGSPQVLVTFLLTEDVNIPKGSKAKAYSSDLMGTKAVEIIYNMETTEYVKSGDTLISDAEANLQQSVNAQIAPLKKKTEDLIGSIDSAVTVVTTILNPRTRENLDKSFESVRKAIITLEQTAYKLDDLVGSEKTKISGILTHLNNITANLDKNGQRIDNILANFNKISDTLANAQLAEAVNNTNKSMKELNTLLAGINNGQGTLGKLAKSDTLYYNLNKSVVDLDKLLKDLRYNPDRYIHFSVFGKKDKNKPKDDEDKPKVKN
jgi:phospholipid/cholesterol/gamma-HCH transport system substrate-binding protein